MANATRNREIFAQYAFEVHDTSDGLLTSKFQKCTGGKMTFNIATLSEGGALADMKEATFGNVTLSRGMSVVSGFYNWCLQLADFMAHSPEGAGVASPGQLRNLRLNHLRRDRTVGVLWHMYNCQPADFVPGEADNTSNELAIESLEVAYEYAVREAA
jgi:phage tail-like protein